MEFMKKRVFLGLFCITVVAAIHVVLTSADLSVKPDDLVSKNLEALSRNEFDGFVQGFVTDSKWIGTGEYEYIYGYLGGIYVEKKVMVNCCRVTNPGTACNVAALGEC